MCKFYFSICLTISLSCILSPFVSAEQKAQTKPAKEKNTNPTPPAFPQPTLSNVAYGEHPRHRLDFWKAESSQPTPLVFVVHGGGWTGGDKDRVTRVVQVERLLAENISVVSINYRYTTQAKEAGITPPVKAPLEDAARALQFVRSQANEWNIDKSRIAAAGSSAGACTSLWLAFHDDLAQPSSPDLVARESTRVLCAAVIGAQTSLDPKQMKEWIPNSKYGAHAFGITAAPGSSPFEAFLAQREKIAPWIAEYSPYELVSADDPAIYLTYGKPPALGQAEKDPTHSANFGVKLQEKCQSVKVNCELVYPGAPGIKHDSVTNYLITHLKPPSK